MCWAERFSAKLNSKAWTEIPWPLHYSGTMIQFGNGMLYCLAIASEAPIQRFHNSWVSIWGQIHWYRWKPNHSQITPWCFRRSPVTVTLYHYISYHRNSDSTRMSSWCNGVSDGLQNPSKRVWTPVLLLRSLIPLGKVWIQLFSLQLWVGQTGFFGLGEATSLGEGKLWIQTC